MMSDPRVREAQELLGNITPGEWQAFDDDGTASESPHWNVRPPVQDDGMSWGWRWFSKADATFIAAAPRLVRNLLAEVVSLTARIEELSNAIHPSRDHTWTVKMLADLAEAHRTDSLDVDASADASGAVDYAAARLARHQRAEQADARVLALEADTGELVSIRALVSDREEVGTYAKVEAILVAQEQADARVIALREGMEKLEQEIRQEEAVNRAGLNEVTDDTLDEDAEALLARWNAYRKCADQLARLRAEPERP